MNIMDCETRELTILSTDIRLIPEHEEPDIEEFLVMDICFDKESSNTWYPIYKVDGVLSKTNTIKNLFHITNSKKASELNGKKIIELRFKLFENKEWITGGYGAVDKDEFIDVYADSEETFKLEVLKKMYLIDRIFD